MTRRAVFLDRDGVLNDAVVRGGIPYPPANVTDVRVSADAATAVERLRRSGFHIVVVTNQPDVARGQQTRERVEAINELLRRTLGLDEFRVCYHDDSDGCDCRKPKPGLLLTAAADLALDLQASVMVGDRWRDVDAGHRAGCKTVLICSSYSGTGAFEPNVRVRSLTEAVDWILSSGDITQ